MAHYENRFCRWRPWSNCIRKVGRGGRVNCVDPETYKFLHESTGRFFTSGRDFLLVGVFKISDFGKKEQLI